MNDQIAVMLLEFGGAAVGIILVIASFIKKKKRVCMLCSQKKEKTIFAKIKRRSMPDLWGYVCKECFENYTKNKK